MQDWNHHCLCGETMRLMNPSDRTATAAQVFWCRECGACAVHVTGYPVQRYNPKKTDKATTHEEGGLRIEKRDVIYTAVLECGHLVGITKEQYENASHVTCYKCEAQAEKADEEPQDVHEDIYGNQSFGKLKCQDCPRRDVDKCRRWSFRVAVEDTCEEALKRFMEE